MQNQVAIDRINRLVQALKPFADLGEKWAPHYGPTKALPPDGNASLMDLHGLKIKAFIDAYQAIQEE